VGGGRGVREWRTPAGWRPEAESHSINMKKKGAEWQEVLGAKTRGGKDRARQSKKAKRRVVILGAAGEMRVPLVWKGGGGPRGQRGQGAAYFTNRGEQVLPYCPEARGRGGLVHGDRWDIGLKKKGGKKKEEYTSVTKESDQPSKSWERRNQHGNSSEGSAAGIHRSALF